MKDRTLSEWFRRTFLTGILFLVPVFATIWVAMFLYNSTIRPIAGPMVRYALGHLAIPVSPLFVTLAINLAAALMLVSVILFVGFLGRNVLGRRLLKLGESLVARVPVLRGVYSAVKQFMETFFSEQKATFKQVVLVEYPRPGIHFIGFVASRIQVPNEPDILNVFLPTTPNPTSGWFAMVREDSVQVLDMSVEDAMRIVVSAGVLFSEDLRARVLKNIEKIEKKS
ncbi:DUF502 domain-containing protein [bacterium]|nr:DUF502 domain-containing protein [bacterium]